MFRTVCGVVVASLASVVANGWAEPPCECFPEDVFYDSEDECACLTVAFPCEGYWIQPEFGPLEGWCLPPCPGNDGPTDCQSFASQLLAGPYGGSLCFHNVACWDPPMNSPEALQGAFIEWAFQCAVKVDPDCDRNNNDVIDCGDLADFFEDATNGLTLTGSCGSAVKAGLICRWLEHCKEQSGLSGGACVSIIPCTIELLSDDLEALAATIECMLAGCNDLPPDGTPNPKLVPGGISPPWGGCGGGASGPMMAGFSNGSPPLSANPVDVAFGDKSERATDLVVALAGIPFAIQREYTSDPAYTGTETPIVGEHWSASVFKYTKFEVTGSGSGACCSAGVGGSAGGYVTMPCTSCSGGSFASSIPVSGPTAQTFEKTSVTVGGTTYPVWRLVEPGAWRVDFLREWESGDNSAWSHPGPELVGKILRAADVYGNRHDYRYTTFEAVGGGNVVRLTSVTCLAADDELQATIYLSYLLGPGTNNPGKLSQVDVYRPNPQESEAVVLTQRALYTYLEDNMSPQLGTLGDLVEVRVDERVDPAPGDTADTLTWRSRITQYRYHTGTSETSDDDGDGFIEEGSAHQLKMVINPEQVEFYARARAAVAGGNHWVHEYAPDLRALDDADDTDPAGLSPLELAAKFVPEYEIDGSPTEGRVKTEVVMSSCGCGGSSAQGLRCDYEYFSSNPNTRTTKVTESRKTGPDPDDWEAHRIRYADMERPGSAPSSGADARGWYLVNDAVTDPARTTMYWVTHYVRSGDGKDTVERIYQPSVMATYSPGSAGSPPSYTANDSVGLAYAFAYDSGARQTEVRIRNGGPTPDTSLSAYSLVTKTTYGSSGQEHLPVSVQRIRTDGNTSLPGDGNAIETTSYAYGFHNADTAIAWVKTTVESETTLENGPATVYSSYDVFDERGLGTWSVAADGSTTKRVYDNDDDGSGGTAVSRTGSVVKTTRNASRGSGSGFPTASPYTSGDGFTPASDRSSDGGSLTTTVRRDNLGRVQETSSPGGVTHVTTREMRTCSEDDRTNLYYYAEVSLPYNLTGTTFDGPATVTWINAGGKSFASRSHKLTADHADAAGTPYRQVVDGYSLDTGSSGLLARSLTLHHVSGLVELTRAWHEPNGSGTDAFYETGYTYDSLGRVETITSSTDAITRYGVPEEGTVSPPISEEAGYDFLDRVKIVTVSVDGSAATTSHGAWTVTERRYYDSQLVYNEEEERFVETEGTGDGNLTAVYRPVDGTSANDRVTRTLYDWRNRPAVSIGPVPPYAVTFYDNLDRPTESVITKQTLSAVPANVGALTDDDFVSYTRTGYSQRGLAFRTETAIDPTVVNGSPTFLANNSWFDEVGRVVGAWGPNAPAMKQTYDGLGRVTATYVTDRGGDQNPQPSTGSYAGYGDVHATHASVLTADRVLEQTETRYITTSGPRLGLPDLVTVRRRAHDDTGTDSLAGASSAVVSYASSYYDVAGRLTHSVDYGTGLSTFSAGGTAPPVDQSDLPELDGSEGLVTIREYDDRGFVSLVTDPAGTETAFWFDGLGRTYATAENHIDATVSWSSSLGRWVADGVGTTDGTDRVTSSVFDGSGRVVKYVAHQQKVSSDGDRDEVTQYVYGVTPAAVSGSQVQSDLWSNDLLLKVVYPDDSSGDGTVFYGYNRQGELAEMEDQNDTMHAYARDLGGRVTSDTVSLASGSVIDGTITKIETDYDDDGRVARVASRSSASGNPILNEVAFEYTELGQIAKVWQDANGVVSESGGAPTGDTRLVAYAYASAAVNSAAAVKNYSRLSSMDYPRNANSGSSLVTASLAYDYGSSTSVDNIVSRVSGMALDSTKIVNYAHIGRGIVALVDYEVPDVQLDRTLSHDGKRRTVGYTTQSVGVYPGLDRYGRIARQTWADGGLTQHATNTNPFSNIPPIVEVEHAYDTAGSRTASGDARHGSLWPMSQTYEYDGLHRLTAAKRGIWNGSSVGTQKGNQEWALDPLGNWSEWKSDTDLSGSFSTAETETRDHNLVNELTNRDQGTGGMDEALTYDLNGNLRTRVANSVTTTYTHDAWNRLVKVTVGSGTVLEQEHNGLTWRTLKRSDTNSDGTLDEERTFAYSANWQLLEERVDSSYVSLPGLNKRLQHFWGKRYIDDPVILRHDVNNDGDYADTNEGTWYHLTDSMFSTVAMLTPGATVAERVSYYAYGTARHHWIGDVDADGDVDGADRTTVNGLIGKSIGQTEYRSECDLDRDGTITTGDRTIASTSNSALASGLISDAAATGPDNAIGWDGYVFNAETRMYTVRHRSYELTLGRWLERDQLGLLQGPLLYQYSSSAPITNLDPSGLSDLRLPGGGIRWDIDPKPRPPAPPVPAPAMAPAPRPGPITVCNIALRCGKVAKGLGTHCGIVMCDDFGCVAYDGGASRAPATTWTEENPPVPWGTTGASTQMPVEVCYCIRAKIARWNAISPARTDTCRNSNWALKCVFAACGVSVPWPGKAPIGYNCKRCIRWGVDTSACSFEGGFAIRVCLEQIDEPCP